MEKQKASKLGPAVRRLLCIYIYIYIYLSIYLSIYILYDTYVFVFYVLIYLFV